MAALNPSKQGLAKIKQARTEQGRPIDDFKWLEEASSVLGVNYEEKGFLADGISEGTWKRFLAGQRINTPAFKAYCEVLKLNWQEVVSLIEFQDWDSAPDVSVFYGRSEELSKLEQWIVKDRCRLVALLGMGGIGKTALSVRCAQQIASEFKYLIWRSLRGAPPIQDFLAELIQFLSDCQKTDLSVTVDGRVSQLIECLQNHKCLVILDNWETVLGTHTLAGHYREGYEGYGELLRRVGESFHKSCLMLTSWEKPTEIAALEGPNLLIRSLQVTGLGLAARDLLREKGLFEEEVWEELIKVYRGNPLALKIIATTIQDLFAGSVADFLIQNTLFLGDFEYLLNQQFNRLSELEREIMYCLSVREKAISLCQLQKDIKIGNSLAKIIKSLESLGRRSLIEKIKQDNEVLISLQPVVKKYAKTLYASR